MKRHVLVTGGSGMIGSAIVRRLAAADCLVTALSRHSHADSNGNVRWIRADFSVDIRAVLQNLPAVDAVIHAAAATCDAGDSDSLSTLAETNIRGSEMLFRWCAERAVQRVVLIGGLVVLRRPLRVPIAESDPVGPTSPYAMSKLWNEEQLFRHARKAGFTAIVLRVSSPIPASLAAMHPTVVRIWLEAALRGVPLQVFGSGNRTQDFVSCDDAAEAVLCSLGSPSAAGVYHIGSGVPLSMHDLAKTIARFRNTPIVFAGDDPNDVDRWHLSLERARIDLHYAPKQTGQQAIESLARLTL